MSSKISDEYANKNLLYVSDVSKFAEHNGIGWKVKNKEASS